MMIHIYIESIYTHIYIYIYIHIYLYIYIYIYIRRAARASIRGLPSCRSAGPPKTVAGVIWRKRRPWATDWQTFYMRYIDGTTSNHGLGLPILTKYWQLSILQKYWIMNSLYELVYPIGMLLSIILIPFSLVAIPPSAGAVGPAPGAGGRRDRRLARGRARSRLQISGNRQWERYTSINIYIYIYVFKDIMFLCTCMRTSI